MTIREAEDLLDWQENNPMIGDQLKPKPQQIRYIDPEELLAGRCMTCGVVVHCLRQNAVAGTDRPSLGGWNDLLSTECPGLVNGRACGARVFVMSAAKFAKLIK